MTVNEAKQKVIAVAVNNLGYHEVGDNRTKFAEGTWDNQFYGWELNGQPWCDVFADYCYCEPFGIAKGKALTYQTGGGSALCSASAQYYKNNGAWFNYPEPGDQIFFYYGGAINHTGIVESVQGSGANWTSCTTIEGNSSDMVARRTYYRGNGAVAGFGRPNWKVVADSSGSSDSSSSADVFPTPTPTMVVTRYGERSDAVKDLQEKLIKLGYDVGRDGADGQFGLNTLAAVKKFQREHNLVVDGEVGDMTRAALGAALKKDSGATAPTEISKPAETETKEDVTFAKGDKVKIKDGSTWYNSRTHVPQFVLNDTWIIYAINGDRAVVNKNASGTNAIMSPISTQDLIKV